MRGTSFLGSCDIPLIFGTHRPQPRCVTRAVYKSESSKPVSLSRRSFGISLLSVLCAAPLSSTELVQPAQAARPEGVNRPDLLPKEITEVIDLERFLASGEVRQLKEKIKYLEQRTGFKIRVLTQRYPQTPGLAIRDYWGVDDNTVVIVADYFSGNGQLLKFNVGANVDKILPPRFWSILSANYGNKFFLQKNSESMAIFNSVESIRTCLLKNGCVTPPDLSAKF